MWQQQEEVVFGASLGHESVWPSYLNLEGLAGSSCQESIHAGSFSLRGVADGPEGLVLLGDPPLEGASLHLYLCCFFFNSLLFRLIRLAAVGL